MSDGSTLGTLALAYGVGVALAPLAQLRRIRRRRSAADVSLTWLALYTGGCLIWLLYGVEIGSLALVGSQVVGFAVGAATIAFAWVHRRGPPQGADTDNGAQRAVVRRRGGRPAAGTHAESGRHE